jgi:hypothetical protein
LVNSKLGDAKPFLTEGIVEKGDEYIWCKTNVTDKTNQICVIKTPSSLDKMGCQTQTGNYARNKQYVNPIKIDVSETNVCKSVWEKMK